LGGIEEVHAAWFGWCDQQLGGRRVWHAEHGGTAGAEVFVAVVHARRPNVRVEQVVVVALWDGHAGDADQFFTVRFVSAARAAVAGDREHTIAVGRQATGGPDPLLAAQSGPAGDLRRIIGFHADDPAVVAAAVAIVAAKRDVQDAVDQRQRAALILIGEIEVDAAGFDLRHIHWKARDLGALIIDGQGMDLVATGGHGCGDVEHALAGVDDGGADDAAVLDAGARAARTLRTDIFGPQRRASGLVERVHVVLRGD